MSPYDFTNVLVAIDGSEGSHKALDAALSLCVALHARLTALAVEGKLPAYAASMGEVDEVKREKDEYFQQVHAQAREHAQARGIEATTDLIPGHAAEVITHYARARPRPDRDRPPRPLPRRLSARLDRRPRRTPRALPGDGGAMTNRGVAVVQAASGARSAAAGVAPDDPDRLDHDDLWHRRRRRTLANVRSGRAPMSYQHGRVQSPPRRRRRRLFGLSILGLAAVLLPSGVLLSGAGGAWQAVGIAAIGYGIGFLVAGLFLLAGHNPGDRRPRK